MGCCTGICMSFAILWASVKEKPECHILSYCEIGNTFKVKCFRNIIDMVQDPHNMTRTDTMAVAQMMSVGR